MFHRRLLLSALAALTLGWAASAAADLKVGGSSTVNPVVAEAAEILRAERGLRIAVDAAGGSSGGIAALAGGDLDIAMSSRPLTEADHERFPAARFHPTRIGTDAVALVVSRDVWDGGIRSLTSTQMRDIYEGRVRNWSQLGGPDRRLVFFNKEPGRGTWEVFARWLYGDPEAAPLVSFPEVGSNSEARAKVASTRGALAPLSAAWADGERVFALAVSNGSAAVTPSPVDVLGGRYPIARPLFVITHGPARGDAAALIDFLLGERGQQLVREHGYLPLGGAMPEAASAR